MGRSIAFSIIMLGTASMALAAADGQSAVLEDVRTVGDLQRVQVSLKVQGTMQVDPVGEQTEVPKAQMSANGWLAYQERILALRPGTQSDPRGSVSGRYYEAAEAKVRVDNHEETVGLADGQRIVLARSTNKTDFASAQTPLSETELGMIMVPGNSLAVYSLLPGKEVSIGETWEHTPQDLVSLVNLDEVTVCEASSRLVDIENGLARMNFVGTVMGRAAGAATELKIEGDYRYDTRWKRINWLSMVIKEDRQSCAASPGFVVSAELKMLAAPLKECPELNPEALEQVARVYKNQERLLRFESPHAGYRLLHGPEWKVMDDRPQSTSFRMVDGGKTVAQCNVRRLKPQEPGKRLALETFQADIEKALGERFGAFAAAREFDRRDGYHVLQVAARGVVAEIPIQWVYYHVTSPTGECGSYVYTMELEASEKFSGQDAAMVNSLEMMALAPKEKKSADVAVKASQEQDSATADRTGAAAAGVR